MSFVLAVRTSRGLWLFSLARVWRLDRSRFEVGEEIGGGEDSCAVGEEFIEEAGVEFGVEVGAAVAEDDEAIIGVGGMEQSGEDDAAGGDAEEDERVDFAGAEDHFEVRACEGADAVLGDDDVALARSHGGMNRAGGAEESLLMLGIGADGGEERVARADFGEARAEADLNVDDRDAGGAGAFEDARDAGEEGFRLLRVLRDDEGLEVHAEDGGAGGIEREWRGHRGIVTQEAERATARTRAQKMAASGELRKFFEPARSRFLP